MLPVFLKAGGQAAIATTITSIFVSVFFAVYVVFGASGGIGSALSKRLLAQPGATVVVAGRDEGRLQQLVSSIGGGVPLVGDPCDPKQVSAAAAEDASWCCGSG
jgi:NADP-dependent 3-hydroxy acid dehydrogenase YdfG